MSSDKRYVRFGSSEKVDLSYCKMLLRPFASIVQPHLTLAYIAFDGWTADWLHVVSGRVAIQGVSKTRPLWIIWHNFINSQHLVIILVERDLIQFSV